MAAYAYHAAVLGHEDDEVNPLFCEAFFKIGYEENTEAPLSTVLKVGEMNLKCMALLDKANTATYGTPEPTEVTLTVEKGPFIVVTGHDLKDLQLLLEQTSGKGGLQRAFRKKFRSFSAKHRYFKVFHSFHEFSTGKTPGNG